MYINEKKTFSAPKNFYQYIYLLIFLIEYYKIDIN